MKTPFALLMTCLCVLPVCAKYSGGSGTAADPYRIATAADLIALGEAPEDYDQHFVLTADIDLDPNLPGRRVFDRALIAPDMDRSRPPFQGALFTGVLDGRGHTIAHLTIAGGWYLGLFGQTGSGAQIRRVSLQAVEIEGTNFYVGALVGRNEYGSITACHSSGSIAGFANVGGLVGCNGGGSITACRGSSSVRGTGWGVGGLVGYNCGRIVMSCGRGSVSGTGSAVGGLVGDHEGSISTSYASGPVHGEYYVGGLVGDHEGSITTSYATGSVSGKHYVGGLAGEHQGSITMSYSCGSVQGVSFVGGLVGSREPDGTVSRSFWDTDASGQSASDSGTGKTTPEMQTAETFVNAGWDVVDRTTGGLEGTWSTVEGLDYPRLTWEWWASLPQP